MLLFWAENTQMTQYFITTNKLKSHRTIFVYVKKLMSKTFYELLTNNQSTNKSQLKNMPSRRPSRLKSPVLSVWHYGGWKCKHCIVWAVILIWRRLQELRMIRIFLDSCRHNASTKNIIVRQFWENFETWTCVVSGRWHDWLKKKCKHFD